MESNEAQKQKSVDSSLLIAMNSAAPDGAPPRRINYRKISRKTGRNCI